MLARTITPLLGLGLVAVVLAEAWPRPPVVPVVAPRSPDGSLRVLRRLHLGLVGTVPSLEEIRHFESMPAAGRLDRWTERLLDDPRHHRWLASELARVFVGEDDGAFLVFRRGRFVDFLAEDLAARTPYDAIVRRMITARGLWTSRPETNFVTAAAIRDDIDENELTSRTVRAFLGQRIDCAECHDHPFDDWTQQQFRELAAFYGSASYGPLGVHDSATTTIAAAVPYGAAYLPLAGAPRERLAAWITHTSNRRFARATVNRVWAILFGRPYVEPVDELPDPEDHDPTLDGLADDFLASGYDLRALIRTVTRTETFRGDDFPVTPLGTAQLAGALLQSSSARTLRPDAGLPTRAVRYLRTNDFTKRYGKTGEGGTISQALVRMNGKLVNDLVEPNPFSLTGRVAHSAASDDAKLDALYLALLTRRPTAAERAHFAPLEDEDDVEDVAWALVNSPEMSWHH